MSNEIIYVCDSENNKNVREGELEILRKFEDQKYFEFGENEMNIKKRFYKDLETLNRDFDALLKLKNNKQEPIKEEYVEVADDEFRSVPIIEKDEEELKKEVKKNYKKLGKKSSLF